MDDLSREVPNLPRNTLLAGEERLYEAEAVVAKEIDAVLSPAKKALEGLEAVQNDISDQRESVTFIARESNTQPTLMASGKLSKKRPCLARLSDAREPGHGLPSGVAGAGRGPGGARQNLNIEMASGIFERAMVGASIRPRG